MAIKADRWIKRMALEHGMIEPFEDRQVRAGRRVVRLSSYGYDMPRRQRVQGVHQRLQHGGGPEELRSASRSSTSGRRVHRAAELVRAGATVEYFRIPRDVLTVCLGKSTYARCGIIVNVTPFEPEWEGHVTIEISNTTPLPAKIYANEGIAQVLFFQSDEPCEMSYKDKKGKYQAQRGVTLPKI